MVCLVRSAGVPARDSTDFVKSAFVPIPGSVGARSEQPKAVPIPAVKRKGNARRTVPPFYFPWDQLDVLSFGNLRPLNRPPSKIA